MSDVTGLLRNVDPKWYRQSPSQAFFFSGTRARRNRKKKLIKRGGEKEGLVATACACAKNP